MPFDPTLPAANSGNSSAEMRSQLTSLKALIDAIQNLTAAQVTSTTTLDPNLPATASVSISGTTLNFTFGIPKGFDGSDGPPGEVSQIDLDDAINGTSNNSDGVELLSMAASDSDVQTIADKVDELLLALRRN